MLKQTGYFSQITGKTYANKGLAKAAEKKADDRQYRQFLKDVEKLAQKFGKQLQKA